MSSIAELYVCEDLKDFFAEQLTKEFGEDWSFDTAPFIFRNEVKRVMKIDIINEEDKKIGEIEVESKPELVEDTYGSTYFDWQPKKILSIKKVKD